MESLYLDERFTAPSIFTDVVVCEHVVPYDLHCVIYQTEEVQYRKIENLKKYYQKYKYQYCTVLDCYLSEWKLKPHGYGRIHPKNWLSLSVFHRPTRHALSKKKYVDFDIVNCNYSVILGLMKKNGFSHSNIEYYCQNRKEVLADVMRVFKCSKDEAKNKFIVVSMGGRIIEYDLLIGIQAELDPLFRKIKSENPDLPTGDKEFSSIAFYLMTIERFLQESSIKMLHEEYKIPLHDFIPCQDGFMILQDDYQPDMLSHLNNNEFGVDWIIKPFDEACELNKTKEAYIPFNLTNYRDVDYAKMMLELELPDIITTGQDKNLESYKFNGIYWKQIALHNADFYTGYFANLYTFLNQKIKLFKRAIMTRDNYKSKDEMKKIKDDQKMRKTQLAHEEKKRFTDFKKRQKEFELEKKAFEKAEKDRLKVYENKKKVALKSSIEFNEVFEPQQWTKRFDEIYEPNAYEESNREFIDIIEMMKSFALNDKNILILNTHSSIEHMITVLLKQSYKSNIEWNKNPYLFVFENCVWDIKLKKQVTPCKEQFMNMSCGYDYVKPENCDEVNAFIKSVFPDEELRKYYLKKQATMLTQEHPQYLFVQTGVGQNGKSVLSDLTKATLDKYGYKIGAIVLQSSQKVGACPELANLRNMRGVWFSEPSAEVRLCSNTIKELTGDREIQARGLYKSDTCVKLNFTLSGDTNAFPLLDCIDGGIERRIVPIPFEAIAVSQEDYDKAEDKKLIVVKQLKFETERWHNENRIAMFHVLLDAYEFEFDFSKMPEKCKTKKANYLQSSSDIYSFIQETFTEDKNKFVKLKDIYTAYKDTSVFRAMKKEAQRGLNLSTFTEKLKIDSSLKKNIVERNGYFNTIQMTSDVLTGWTRDEKEPDDI
jgi:P4 family phage/plasmid primase-like protien